MRNQKNREKVVIQFSFFVAITMAIVTFITFVIAILTPPLSGPFCKSSCFEYPYTDVISRFPRDYIWMYPAMLVALLFVVLMICIHHYAENEKKIFSQIGLSFALISSIILIADYFVQVSVIQPGLLKGETEGIAMLTQFNPHGVFIALEEIGYLIMSISFFSIVPVFYGKGGLRKAIRMTFITGLLLIVFSLILVSIKFGIMREYIFEVIVISIVWLELIISSILLSIEFRRAMKT